MAENKTATFGIRIPVETNAAASATDVNALRASIASAKDQIKAYASSMGNLKGKSDEVKAAKEKLKAALNSERELVSRNVLALGKLGQTLTQTKTQTTGFTKTWNDLKSRLSGAKEAVTSSGEFEALSMAFGGASAAAAVVAKAAAFVGAALATMTVAVIGATVAIGAWILESSNALRTMNLFREAASGSARDAGRWGEQIEALGRKLPLTREELSGLTLDIEKAFRGTRISGPAMVDAFNAVGQASAAMGKQAGAAIQGILERGKQFGRGGLGLFELQGTGIDFSGVAKNLSKNLGVSLNDAKTALMRGLVPIDALTKAFADTTEQRFGQVNLKRMLDFNVIMAKAKDTLTGLTKDVKLEPILDGFKSLTEMLDSNSVTGAALKGIIEDIADVLGTGFKDAIPTIQIGFIKLLTYATQLEIKMYDVRDAIREAFPEQTQKNLKSIWEGLESLDGASGKMTGTLTALAFGLADLFVPLLSTAKFLAATGYVLFESVLGWLSLDWGSIGTGIVDGIKKGLTAAWDGLKGAVTGMGRGILTTFKETLLIQSPSKAFEVESRQIPAGSAKGIRAGSEEVQRATAEMAPRPIDFGRAAASNSKGAGGSAGGAITVNVTLEFPNAKSGADVTAAVASPAFKVKLMQAFEEIARGAGVAIQGAQ